MRKVHAVLFMFWATFAIGQTMTHQTMTHEEEVVRTTYAKLSFADETRIIIHSILENRKAEERSADKALNSRLDFQLSNFKTGVVEEIFGQPLNEFAGLPQAGDDILDITPGTYNYSQSGAAAGYLIYADVRWIKAQNMRDGAATWPMEEIFKLNEMGGPFDRYATYTATVTFAGKSTTYHAAALFSSNPDVKIKIHFLDAVGGGSMSMALDLLAKSAMNPVALLKSDLKNVPVVRKWLRDNQQSCNRKQEGELCCDPATGRCGVHSKDIPIPTSMRIHPVRLEPAAFHPNVSALGASFFQAAPAPKGCAKFNREIFFPAGSTNAAGHNTGGHTYASVIDARCTYLDGPAPGPCDVSCQAIGTGTMDEIPGSSVKGMFTVHNTAAVNASGAAASIGGGSAACAGNSAGSVVACVGSCNVDLTLTASGDGLSATVKFPQSAVYNDQNTLKQISCAAQATTPTPTPTPTPAPPPPPPPPPDPGDPCGTGFNGGDQNGNVPVCSPILIDITGNGFALTDAVHGVKFDWTGDGTLVQTGWTANANNAFLALDLNNNGVINSGRELFGNFTVQPSSDHPNGFAALALYDHPLNGGNGDGIIDARDRIFSSLRLWVDANHDGICQPGELHTLPELGVFNISLDYEMSRRTDQYGNAFRYRARVNVGVHGEADKVGRTAYDVFFVDK